MLKFDKSTNWPLIADACIDVLGTSIYAPPGDKANLNECTLRELRGKVIVLFTKDGCGACGLTALQRRQRGILEWKNLYSVILSGCSTTEKAGFPRPPAGKQERFA